MPSSRVTDPPPAVPDAGAPDRPATPGVEDDPIGELLRHHHERAQVQSERPVVPRGSAELAPVIPSRPRRASRPRGTPTRALRERFSRSAPRSQTMIAPAPTTAPSRHSHPATLSSFATRRRLSTSVVVVAVLAGLVMILLGPRAQTRSRSPSTRAGGQLGDFGSLRSTLTRIDEDAVLMARGAITQERRVITAERARQARRGVARRRAAERRDRARRRRAERATAHTVAAGASTPTISSSSTTGQSAPAAPTSTATQASTQTTPVAPTQTTPRSGSSTSSSGSTHAPAYGQGGVLGAGHSSDSS